MKKKKVFALVLVAFFVALVMVASLTPKASAETKCFDVTFLPTNTNHPWATPTPYSTPNNEGLPPCPEDTNTPPFGIVIPTVIVGTETPGTATPVTTQTGTAITGENLIINFFSSTHGGDIQDPALVVYCMNEHEEEFMLTLDQTGSFDGDEFACLIMFSGQHTGGFMDTIELGFQIGATHPESGHPIVYTMMGYEGNCEKAEYNYIMGWHEEEVDGFNNVDMHLYCKPNGGNSGQVSLIVKQYNWSGSLTATPTPSATPWCEELGEAPEFTPIAELPEIVFTYGGCTTILPEVNILGFYQFPGFEICITWVTLNARFLTITLDMVLTVFIVIGMGFAIFNEFRN